MMFNEIMDLNVKISNLGGSNINAEKVFSNKPSVSSTIAEHLDPNYIIMGIVVAGVWYFWPSIALSVKSSGVYKITTLFDRGLGRGSDMVENGVQRLANAMSGTNSTGQSLGLAEEADRLEGINEVVSSTTFDSVLVVIPETISMLVERLSAFV